MKSDSRRRPTGSIPFLIRRVKRYSPSRRPPWQRLVAALFAWIRRPIRRVKFLPGWLPLCAGLGFFLQLPHLGCSRASLGCNSTVMLSGGLPAFLATGLAFALALFNRRPGLPPCSRRNWGKSNQLAYDETALCISPVRIRPDWRWLAPCVQARARHIRADMERQLTTVGVQ